MPRLPVVSAKELVRALEKFGFSVVRQKGSHVLLKNIHGLITTVPMHTGSVPKGTLRAILKDAEISTEALIQNL